MLNSVLTGIWVMSICTNTIVKDSINHVDRAGYTMEFYQFGTQGEFDYTRNWYKDSQCKKLDHVEKDNGTYSLGKVTNLYSEIDFKMAKGSSLGWVRFKNANEVELTRGLLGASRSQKPETIFTFKKKD